MREREGSECEAGVRGSAPQLLDLEEELAVVPVRLDEGENPVFRICHGPGLQLGEESDQFSPRLLRELDAAIEPLPESGAVPHVEAACDGDQVMHEEEEHGPGHVCIPDAQVFGAIVHLVDVDDLDLHDRTIRRVVACGYDELCETPGRRSRWPWGPSFMWRCHDALGGGWKNVHCFGRGASDGEKRRSLFDSYSIMKFQSGTLPYLRLEGQSFW